VASTIRRDRRSSADIDRVKQTIIEVLEADHPMTVRQVFYQLVVRDVVEKTELEYSRTVVRLLSEMRLEGELPFEWITDSSRSRSDLQSFNSPAEAVRETAKFYRRNAMNESAAYIEVWCEKEALASILWDEVGAIYGVPVVVSKGMPSLTQLYDTAKYVNAAHRAGKKTYIYQFGDHDPTGVIIPQTILKRLRDFCQRLRCPPPEIWRAALLPEQIEEFNLPSRPTKRTGNPHAKKFEGESTELDALPSAELRRLARECIEGHISNTELAILHTAEASERMTLLDLARGMTS
jgi:hypothetical protein